MKKIVAGTLAALMLSSGVALAGLDDDKESIADQYGEYRMVIDTDNQIWARAEWEGRGVDRAKADSYMYSFTREGLRTQMEVRFSKNGSVQAQRFTPDMAVKIKDFKTYYPEVYDLLTSPKADAFASYAKVTSQFQEIQSPVTLGIVVKETPAGQKGAYYTLLAFNIQDEGRLIKNSRFIDENTDIREFTIEKTYRTSVNEAFDSGEWQPLKNFFHE